MSDFAHPQAGLLGKAPATDFGDANVLFKMVQAAELPAAPAHFGHGFMFHDWGMLGNDSVGDCAFAGSAHEHMCWTGIGNHGKSGAQFTTAGVLGAYSGLTGYQPGNPATDRGTDVSQLMDYRRRVGIPDAAGSAHKIDLAVRLEPVGGPFNWDQFIRAVSAFKCVAVGTLMPSSAMQQFNAGQPWSYIGDHNIEGGHYIPAVGSLKSDSEVSIITWGRRQIMNRNFYEAYVDELWVPLSREAMASIDVSLSAVDWAKVESIARGLGQADA
jgi:hypothetical protein